MADHLDAPGLTSPAMDTRVDITDHYAFQKPGDPERTILILNVNPLAPTHANEFRSDAVYETLVDTNGDAVPDIAFRYRFTAKDTKGRQFAFVTRAELPGPLEDGHLYGEEIPLVNHAPVSFDSNVQITRGVPAFGAQFYAGLRSDPFFFDLLGFLNNFHFTGSDFFVDKNVFGIALDIPSKLLGDNPNVGIWVRTLVPMMMQPDHVTQADQMGRPAINTVFNHGGEKNIFNLTQPADQRTTQNGDGKTYLESFVATLESFGYSAGDATDIAEILLPDVLTFDYSSSAGFLNGRKLTDDVIDIELNLVTRGALTGDGVGPHTDLLSDFPYLGNPH
jgi:Domain of unknown function (DUF4331)